jgi:hypothetical protein
MQVDPLLSSPQDPVGIEVEQTLPQMRATGDETDELPSWPQESIAHQMPEDSFFQNPLNSYETESIAVQTEYFVLPTPTIEETEQLSRLTQARELDLEAEQEPASPIPHHHLAACGVLQARLMTLLEPNEKVLKAQVFDRFKAVIGEYYALTCVQAKSRSFLAQRLLLLLRREEELELQRQIDLERDAVARQLEYAEAARELDLDAAGQMAPAPDAAASYGMMQAVYVPDDAAVDTAADQVDAPEGGLSSGSTGKGSTDNHKRPRPGSAAPSRVPKKRPTCVPALALDRVQFGEPVQQQPAKVKVSHGSHGSQSKSGQQYGVLIEQGPPLMLVSTLQSQPVPEGLDRFVAERLQEKKSASYEDSQLLYGTSDTQLPALSKSASQPIRPQSSAAGGGKRNAAGAAKRSASSGGGLGGARAQQQKLCAGPGIGNSHQALNGLRPQRTSPQQQKPTDRPSSKPLFQAKASDETRAFDLLLAKKMACAFEFPKMSKECYGRPRSAPNGKVLKAGGASTNADHMVYPLRPGQQVDALSPD